MSKGIVRLHDKLSSGGEVISASSTTIIDGIRAVLVNDLVSCPIEGHGVNRIVGTSPEWQSDSEQAAFDGTLEAGDSRHDVLNNYKTSFDKFSNSAEGESALKGARIRLLALIFNCREYASLLAEGKGDAKSRAQITSAFLGAISTASEIVEPMVKHGLQHGTGATSVKFVGATAGTSAAVINLALDAGDLISEIRSEHTRWIFVGLNSGKTAVDAGLALKGASGLLQVLAETELFEGGWLTQLSSKLGEIAAGQFVSFLASWEAMIGIFLIEQLVIYYYGNELQKWCRNGVFGLEPNDKLKSTWQLGYKKPRDKECDNQRKAFNKALGAVL